MGLFGLGGRGKSGGMMNVIRCDEQEYLVWKWRPEGQAVNSTTRENSIRYGSSLRVKDGEVAVFVYKQKDGTMQDFIEGPYDDTIKTANFHVLSSIVGLAFGGESPFQAEIYFINLAGNVQIKFGIPYFDVFDPRFLDFAVPVAVRGTITFNITDYRAFIKLNRMINFTLEDFKKQVKDAVTKYVKSFVANAPQDNGIPVLQLERKIADISDLLQARLSKEMADDFGVNLKRIDLASIEPDKESEGYRELRHVTAEQQTQTIETQTEVNIKNLHDTQAINAENMQESLRIQREEAQRAQRLQTESNFIGAHALDQQTTVLKAGAENLGAMGSMGGFEDLPNPVPASLMYYNEVASGVSGDFYGVEGSVPAVITAGQPVHYGHSVVLPETIMSKTNVEIIVFLVDNATGEVDNCETFAVKDLAVGGVGTVDADMAVRAWGCDGTLVVKGEDALGTVEIYTLDGVLVKSVKTSSNEISLPADVTGIAIVKVAGDNGQQVIKVAL